MSTQAPPRQQRDQRSAVVRIDQNAALVALSAELDRRAAMLADSAASLIDPVKLKGVVLSTFTRTPALWECDPISIARAVVEAAQAGLEPTGSLGGAYLVPFFNSKTGRKEAQLIIGYTGLVKLARRSGEVARVEARIVRQQDEFDFGYGLQPYLTHRPALGVPEDQHNPMILAYAVAHFRGGETQFDVMTAAEILAIRARSKAKDSGPWVTDEAEMWKKTVLRRLSKLMPLTVEAQRILDGEDDIDVGARTATVRPLRAVAPSRIAGRVMGTPAPQVAAGAVTEAHSGDGDPGPDEPVRATPAPGEVEPVGAVAPSPDTTDDGEVIEGQYTDALVVSSEGTVVAPTAAVPACGSPSPYDDAMTCIREQGHAQRLMCRDANGQGTWPRPAGWQA